MILRAAVQRRWNLQWVFVLSRRHAEIVDAAFFLHDFLAQARRVEPVANSLLAGTGHLEIPIIRFSIEK
jgi:hypothetical protein